MSAIVAAMAAFCNYLPDRCAQCWYPQSLHMDRSHKASEHRFIQDLAPRFIESTLIAAGRAIVAASNAAGAGRVVEGAPLEVVGWKRCHRFDSDWAAFGHVGAIGIARHPQRRTDLRPTWLSGSWVWSTAAHDPRPCAWPRPFARGADR